MDNELRRGRKIVLVVIITTIVLSLYFMILNFSLNSTEKVAQHSVRFILTLILSYYLYKGANTVRILSVILYTIAGIFGLIAGIAPFTKVNIGIMILIPAIIYIICAIVLMFSAPVKQYFSKVKSEREPIEDNV